MAGTDLLVGESNGFAVDFLSTDAAKCVAVKVSNVATEYTVDNFFVNLNGTPKQIYDATGTLVWTPHNFCLRSQEFNQTTPWNPTTALTVTADAIAAPDGTTTADRLVETAVNNNHQLIHANIGQVAGATYTLSVYAKAGERNWLAVQPLNENPTNFFDLTNGVVGNARDACSIQAVGGGWYRCSVTYVNVSTSGPAFFLRTANGQTGIYVGDVTKGLYLWGAQLERSPVARTYFPTTTLGRFGLALDYDPITHVPKGMLCEPAATNILKWSTNLSNAVWVTDGSCTITLNAAVAPNGRMEAAKATGSAAWGWWYVYQITAATAGRVSIYAKAAGHRYLFLQDYQAALTDTFDLQTGTVIPTDPSWSPPIGGATIEAVGNGWYRCTSKMSAASIEPSIYGSNTVDGSVINNGVSGIYLWSPQLETTTVATSPIETFAVAVARTVDNYQCPSASINPSATVGSWWIENNIKALPVANSRSVGYSSGASPLFHSGSAADRIALTDGTTLTKTITWVLDTVNKVASAFTSGDRAVTMNSVTVATDTGSVTNLLTPGTSVAFGNSTVGTTSIFGYIRRSYYLPRRMTNTELQERTSPVYGSMAATETGDDVADIDGVLVELWDPFDLGSLLKYWLSADDIGTDDGGGLISSITERIGGIVYTATGAARPLRTLTAFNGYPGWTFDGVAQCFTATSMGQLPTGTTGSEVYMAVSNTKTDAGTVYAFRYGAGGGTSADRAIQRILSTVSRMRITDGTTNLGDTVTNFEGPHLANGIFGATSIVGRLDGANITPATVAATPNTGTVRSRVMANNGAAAGNFMPGAASDILVTLSLNVFQRFQLDGWAAWKTGLQGNLPAGHAYKLAAPVNSKGTLAATETGDDVAAFAGAVIPLAITGSMDVTEAGSDIAVFTGGVTLSGNLTATETGDDTAAFTGKILVKGSLVATEIGDDTATFTGIVLVSGHLTAIEIGNDVLAAYGGIDLVFGPLEAYETGRDFARMRGGVVKTPAKPSYILLNGATVTGEWVSCVGAAYIWTVATSNFNSGIIALEAKGPDGVTPMQVTLLTSKGSVPIGVSELTEMRVTITGSPNPVYSDLRAYDA